MNSVPKNYHANSNGEHNDPMVSHPRRRITVNRRDDHEALNFLFPDRVQDRQPAARHRYQQWPGDQYRRWQSLSSWTIDERITRVDSACVAPLTTLASEFSSRNF